MDEKRELSLIPPGRPFINPSDIACPCSFQGFPLNLWRLSRRALQRGNRQNPIPLQGAFAGNHRRGLMRPQWITSRIQKDILDTGR
jgi:hypothetical protein